MDTGYKNTLGSSNIGSYNRYKLYSRYENRLPGDGSYIRNVLSSGVLITGIYCIYLCSQKCVVVATPKAIRSG